MARKTDKITGKYRVYNTDRSDTDLDAYSKAVQKPRRKWIVWVCLLLAAALFWYLYSQGVLPW